MILVETRNMFYAERGYLPHYHIEAQIGPQRNTAAQRSRDSVPGLHVLKFSHFVHIFLSADF